MKKLLLTGVMALAILGAKAQTTVQEYNYLLKYSEQYLNVGMGILPGHTLSVALQPITKRDAWGSYRTVKSYFFYREGAQKPIALLLIYSKDGGPETYICVPDKGSDRSLWNGYFDTLETLNDTGTALKVIAYTLGCIAANG